MDSRNGHCGATTSRPAGRMLNDCELIGSQGRLEGMALDGYINWSDERSALRQCQELCHRCARCRFFSFSHTWKDCSWYHECERMQTKPTGFLTYRRNATLPQPLTDAGAAAALRSTSTHNRYAICLSGALRSFEWTRASFESELLRPNRVHVFAHIYHDPYSSSNRHALQWLRNQRSTKALVTEAYNKTSIIAAFPEFSRMEQENTYESKRLGRPTDGRLSMCKPSPCYARAGARRTKIDHIATQLNRGALLCVLLNALRPRVAGRKIYLANELRREYERRHGVAYRAVVRARPDLLYETRVNLDMFDLGLTQPMGQRGSRKQTPNGPVLYQQSDVFAVGSPAAMDVYSSLYVSISRLFAERPSRFSGAYVSERLMGDYLQEPQSNITVRSLDHVYPAMLQISFYRPDHPPAQEANASALVPRPSAVRSWLARSQHGACSGTSDHARFTAPSCDSGSIGAFRLPSTGVGSWTTAAAQCLQKCRDCPRCTHISISVMQRECSWFHKCHLRKFMASVPPEFRRVISGLFLSGPVQEPTNSSQELF